MQMGMDQDQELTQETKSMECRKIQLINANLTMNETKEHEGT